VATLKLSIKEELVLNGKDRGSENVVSVTGVTQSFHRVVTCPANQDTTVATFQTAVHTSDGALDYGDVKYVRVTNLDATNEVVLSLQISNDEDGVADGSTSLLLASGRSFVMGAVEEGIACDDDAATVITDTDLHDLESILVDPKTNAVNVEVFIAS